MKIFLNLLYIILFVVISCTSYAKCAFNCSKEKKITSLIFEHNSKFNEKHLNLSNKLSLLMITFWSGGKVVWFCITNPEFFVNFIIHEGPANFPECICQILVLTPFFCSIEEGILKLKKCQKSLFGFTSLFHLLCISALFLPFLQSSQPDLPWVAVQWPSLVSNLK